MPPEVIDVPETYSPLDAAQEDAMRRADTTRNNN